jgi:microcin C transport system substrate-binding protein
MWARPTPLEHFVNRRSLLASTLLALAARRLPPTDWIASAEAQEKPADASWRNGVSLFGDLKYPPGFAKFDYVNADAPKGGSARQIAVGTFDNFNLVVAGVKGNLAAGITLIYDTLLTSSLESQMARRQPGHDR